MTRLQAYDIAFVGHYTKDTIVSPSGTRVVDGGACNYGANVAVRTGLRTAVVTRLAEEDFHVVDDLRQLGVRVLVQATPQSTCLRLVYPTTDVDQRTIYVSSSAGPFTPQEVRSVEAGAFCIGASMRSEVGFEVVRELAGKRTLLAADIQSFLRVNQDGVLAATAWPGKEQVLALVDVLKTDAVEAELLTGTQDMREAARIISGFGPSEVVVTHGQGLLVLAQGQFHEAAWFPRKLVGRSGRGDTTIAAYVAKRLSSPPSEAAVWAAAAASLKMEAEGPFRREIRDVEALIAQKYLGAARRGGAE